MSSHVCMYNVWYDKKCKKALLALPMIDKQKLTQLGETGYLQGK